MVNIPNSHRPYPNSDKKPIRVNPDELALPPYLPDTPEVRKDWAEYLAGIEQADQLTGEALEALKQSGMDENTIVVFMSDHGPTFQHGKMTLYDLGLRVPLIIRAPGIPTGTSRDALVSEIDLLDTLLGLCDLPAPKTQGQSLVPVLKSAQATGHEHIFAEISHRGPLPNDGMQARSVFDGRWKLIYREKVETRWRQVNADSRQFPIWGNRTYAETIRVKDQYPKQYRILQEMDPQQLGGSVPRMELYDLKSDPHEMNNLAGQRPAEQQRLLRVLKQWCKDTNDVSMDLRRTPTQDKTNVLLIVADDMGFSDLGCYGSRIQTPALDNLAAQGIRLSNFRVNPMCVVTRTSLLTGHEHSQSQGYKRSIPLPRALKQARYLSSLSGKWHQYGNPLDHGFETFYGFLEGQINSFTGSGRIMQNRTSVSVPDDWYATDAFTDHAMASIDRAVESDRPFFTYLAYNAPHTPLNVSRDLVDKYDGVFDAGWDVLRRQRFERLKASGLIDANYRLSPAEADTRKWDELPEATRKHEAFRMATYAAVIDRIDQNVARILKHLEQRGVADNTLVLFISDNGGDYGNGNIALDHKETPWEKDASSYMANGWAGVKCSPFRFYKTSTYEGGLRVPCIVRWPKGMEKHEPGSIVSHQTHVSDLYPTLLELAGVEVAPPTPLHGRSMLSLMRDPTTPENATQHPTFWALDTTTRGYLDYPWKIVSINEGPWALFDLANDPSESTDLAEQHPERVVALDAAWQEFADNETGMPPNWLRPLRSEQHGWGLHRLERIWGLQDATPVCSANDVPLNTSLSFTFRTPLDFSNTAGRTLRLYRSNDPDTPIWSADPGPDHPAQGKKSCIFNDLPELKPDTHYFLLADPAWAKAGRKALPPLNDGAYWFRFRTTKEGTAK
jgi:arylsulfatase